MVGVGARADVVRAVGEVAVADGGPGIGSLQEHAVARIHAHVARRAVGAGRAEEHQVAHAGVAHRPTVGELILGEPGDVDTEVLVGVPHEPGAVKASRGLAAEHIGSAQVVVGEVEDGSTGAGAAEAALRVGGAALRAHGAEGVYARKRIPGGERRTGGGVKPGEEIHSGGAATTRGVDIVQYGLRPVS